MSNSLRSTTTVRFQPGVLDMVRMYAEQSNPPLSLNAAINLLVTVGVQVTHPDRTVELRILSEAVEVISQCSKRLASDESNG